MYPLLHLVGLHHSPRLVLPSLGPHFSPRQDNRLQVEVLPGYYLHTAPNTSSAAASATTNGSDSIAVWRCAQLAACLGGPRAGDQSCEQGHGGPLCGTCAPGHYRGLVRCEPCEATEADARLGIGFSFAFAAVVLIVLAFAASRYLWGTVGGCVAQLSDGGGSTAWMCAFMRLTVSRLATGATMVRILVGYSQTIGALRRMLNVRWPRAFQVMLEALDQLSLELIAIVPAECLAGRRLGFVVELSVALTLPILSLASLLVLCALIAPCTGRWSPYHEGVRGLFAAMGEWPQVWDLASWLLLLQYPTLARKSVSAFDCTAFGGDTLLRSDPTMSCASSEWMLGGTLASAGIVVYCLGLPLIFVLVTRRQLQAAAHDSARRRLVHVLTRSYTDEVAWYYEGFDLIRKFLLAGVIFIVAPNTRVQLWFGQTIALVFLLVHLKLEPFLNPACGAVQTAAHLQVLITYTAAQLFFVDDAHADTAIDHDDMALGALLVVANSVAFAIIFAVCCRGLRRVATELGGERLKWADGSVVTLVAPQKAGGSHLFLSHVWAYGQDLAASLKSSLRGFMPSCTIFLDVDDLRDISHLETHVEESEVILIVVTDKYLSSYNCRRELSAAMQLHRQGKPLLLLCETDEAKGATSIARLKAELEALIASGKFVGATAQQKQVGQQQQWAAERLIRLLEQGSTTTYLDVSVIEYHREKHLKLSALKAIAAALINTNVHLQSQRTQMLNGHPTALSRGSTLSKSSTGGKTGGRVGMSAPVERAPPPPIDTLHIGDEGPPPPLPTDVAVYLPPAYAVLPGAASAAISLYDEVGAQLRAHGVRVLTAPIERAPSIVLLAPGAFEEDDIVEVIEQVIGGGFGGGGGGGVGGGAWRQTRVEKAGRAIGDRLSRFVPEARATRVSRTSHARPSQPASDSILALACTTAPFQSYIDGCPEGLKQLGIFKSYMFHKWPTSHFLQRATMRILLDEIARYVAKHGLPDAADVEALADDEIVPAGAAPAGAPAVAKSSRVQTTRPRKLSAAAKRAAAAKEAAAATATSDFLHELREESSVFDRRSHLGMHLGEAGADEAGSTSTSSSDFSAREPPPSSRRGSRVVAACNTKTRSKAQRCPPPSLVGKSTLATDQRIVLHNRKDQPSKGQPSKGQPSMDQLRRRMQMADSPGRQVGACAAQLVDDDADVPANEIDERATRPTVTFDIGLGTVAEGEDAPAADDATPWLAPPALEHLSQRLSSSMRWLAPGDEETGAVATEQTVPRPSRAERRVGPYLEA